MLVYSLKRVRKYAHLVFTARLEEDAVLAARGLRLRELEYLRHH